MNISPKPKWALFNYLRPSYWWVTLFLLLFLVGISSIANVGLAYSLILFFLPAFLTGLSFCADICRTIKLIISFKRKGLLAQLLQDFHEGIIIGNDQARMGNHYIIGRKTTTPVAYNEIQSIYSFTSRFKFRLTSRELRATTASGTRTICYHTVRELAREEIHYVMSLAHKHNPRIVVPQDSLIELPADNSRPWSTWKGQPIHIKPAVRSIKMAPKKRDRK